MIKIFTPFILAITILPISAQIPGYIPTDSLEGYWSFSGNALDASGNSINGSVNGPVPDSDRQGNANSAYNFDGINDWIDLGDNPLLNPGTRDITVSAWIKTTNSSGARIFSKGTHGGSQSGFDIMIYPGSGGKVAAIFCPGIVSPPPYEKIVYSNQPVNDGLWHLITGVITRNNNIKLYVDGVLQSHQLNISNSSSSNIGADTYNASIGASYCFYGTPNVLDEFFNGTIDQVGIWMRSLNECEIKALYYETNHDTTLAITVCDSLTSPGGKYIWKNTGIYRDTLTSFYGCDSIITINLTLLNSTTSTVSPTACGSYTAPDGAVYTSSGTYTAVIPNTAGCDSTITINLTLLNSTTSTVSPTACDSYTAPDGAVYTSSGTYTAVIPNAAGCDSTITIILTLYSLDVSVTTDNNVLTANAAPATYQWLDCNDDLNPITGEVNQTFTATSSSNYAVEISQNGCADTSLCYPVTLVNISENPSGINISLYPNPTSGLVYIDLGAEVHEIKVIIHDASGRVVKDLLYEDKQLLNIIIDEPAGIYFMTVFSENKKAMIRLIKN
jgi:hypothetical protein